MTRTWPVRIPLILALAVLLGLVVAGLRESKEVTPGEPLVSVKAEHEQGYWVSHDWVEFTTPPEKRFDARVKTQTVGLECTRPNCRTCSWMQQFGGEW